MTLREEAERIASESCSESNDEYAWYLQGITEAMRLALDAALNAVADTTPNRNGVATVLVIRKLKEGLEP